jgi:hypothetical protein
MRGGLVNCLSPVEALPSPLAGTPEAPPCKRLPHERFEGPERGRFRTPLRAGRHRTDSRGWGGGMSVPLCATPTFLLPLKRFLHSTHSLPALEMLRISLLPRKQYPYNQKVIYNWV